jgi:hypothetical protein
MQKELYQNVSEEKGAEQKVSVGAHRRNGVGVAALSVIA